MKQLILTSCYERLVHLRKGKVIVHRLSRFTVQDINLHASDLGYSHLHLSLCSWLLYSIVVAVHWGGLIVAGTLGGIFTY